MTLKLEQFHRGETSQIGVSEAKVARAQSLLESSKMELEVAST